MTQTEMDDAQGSSSSNAPAPFLTKTYEMVDDPYTSTVVSWSQSGCSFVVWNPPEFAQDLLPKYFKHNNFSSFVRQLNTYGFRKVDPDQWEFANEEFIRGQKHLLKNIYRRKPIHSHSLQNQVNSSPLTKSEKYEYEKEIKRLKHDKNLLQIELRRHQSEKQSLECQILSLGQKLQGMDSRQNQLTFFLSELMQKPGFPAILSQQVENHNKKRRLSTFDQYFDGAEENRVLTKGNNDGFEMIEKLDSSLKFWEGFLYQVGESFGEERSDFSALSKPSLVVVREVSGSYADGGETWSPRSPSPGSRDISPSSPELTGYKNHSDEPRTPPIRPESLQVDANCNSEASPPMSLAARGLALTASATTAGMNDHFWENFLMEAPDSHLQQDPGNGSDQNASFDRTCDNDGRFRWSTHYRGNNSLTKHVPS